jgi:hypothetical protein
MKHFFCAANHVFSLEAFDNQSLNRQFSNHFCSVVQPSRWSLVCVLCKERMGSCIQCSVKTCKTAYHVTCAFRHNLEMRAIIEDENAEDGVKLRVSRGFSAVLRIRDVDPGSRIPDPDFCPSRIKKQQQKRGERKFVVLPLFCSHIIENYINFELVKKKNLGQFTKKDFLDFRLNIW